ncbi:MAG: hypothetical protein A3A65_02755 [Candidatus Chisholmbacteria bacterium RIFCSPLOWO2_01_FULL_49_14]|uniref:Uncharacterized protein n=1 Tax=Candidatus Chisholmbacteria bacterium RIFCSPLOWO2_01_FULL_49_14 TaxID=1797593 RepID=A0A1G1VZN7_9BACT|nr:MAG: hypothetical protein A3A65_02755 [Candidatus Chisholmbacteria bacterium RIFCSPLOWO2_01_FULL_49_14]
MMVEASPNHPVPEDYLEIDFEMGIDPNLGSNFEILSAIADVDNTNMVLRDNPDFKSNDIEWWKLNDRHRRMRTLFKKVSENEGDTSDPELLSLSKQVVEETELRIQAFKNWVTEQGPAYIFSYKRFYEELRELMHEDA